MARLYFDNDVSLRLAPQLVHAGHAVTTAVGEGLTVAGDEVQLLTAVRRGDVLLTYNRRDFMILHRAWLLWPHAFGFTLPPHNGIVTIDQVEIGEQFVVVEALLSTVSSERLLNQMLWWHPPAGWRSLTGATWTAFKV